MATTSKNTSRKSSAKPLQKRGTPGDHGNLTANEITNLVMQAGDAYKHQISLGRVEAGQSFNDWRRQMVMDRVGKSGISKINRSEFRDVKALFLELAGREDEAFALLNSTGVKSYKPTSDADTWESCEIYVALIQEALASHIRLATASIEELVAEAAQNWYRTETTEFPGIDTADIVRCKAAIEQFGKGPITIGWLLAAARQRTGKPSLTIETLAERLDPETLHGLLSHVRNHISLREGRADLDRRAARRYPKPAKEPILDDPF